METTVYRVRQIQNSHPSRCKINKGRDFPEAQCIRIRAYITGGMRGSIPGQGTKIPHAAWAIWHSAAKENTKTKTTRVTSSTGMPPIRTLECIREGLLRK